MSGDTWQFLVCRNCRRIASTHCDVHGFGCCPIQVCPGPDRPPLDSGHRFDAQLPPRPRQGDPPAPPPGPVTFSPQ